MKSGLCYLHQRVYVTSKIRGKLLLRTTHTAVQVGWCTRFQSSSSSSALLAWEYTQQWSLSGNWHLKNLILKMRQFQSWLGWFIYLYTYICIYNFFFTNLGIFTPNNFCPCLAILLYSRIVRCGGITHIWIKTAMPATYWFDDLR